jgi:hypothetical protein
MPVRSLMRSMTRGQTRVFPGATGTRADHGIECVPRLTNRGAGAGDGLGTVGAHDIVVSPRDAHEAREILHGSR